MSNEVAMHVERIPTSNLADKPLLNTLVDFANNAFDDRMQNYPEMGFEGKRFEKAEDFLEEMGPDGVTFIQYAAGSHETEGSGQIVATAGCKPFKNTNKLTERVESMREEREARERGLRKDQGSKHEAFYTKEHEDQLQHQAEKIGPMVHKDGQEDVPRFEVMTVCVRPDLQGRKMADKLVERVAEEVSSQVKKAGKGPEFKLVVRLMKEVNEKYWLSKGFKPVGEQFFEPATLLLEFQIPPAVSRWAPFLFSFIGRGIFYIFVGSILLHQPAIRIIAGSIIGIVGVGYVVLEYIPQIEPPQNMRDAGGEWGAEQI
ncbi:hypothetical protein Q9189_004089 [Teloschistes chrysophthalmus]